MDNQTIKGLSSPTSFSGASRDLCSAHPLIPVVVIDNPDDAVPTAEALIAGGITCAELTFRTPDAATALVNMAQVPGLTAGAGTVLTVAQANEAIEAGAQFLVSPGTAPAVARVAADAGIVYIPGAATATDIMTCLESGCDVLKFFPAVAAGGLPMLKALSGPFPQVSFVATGGIGPNNLEEWISNPLILSVGGSWMVSRQDIAEHRWDRITELSREAVNIVKGIR